MTAVDVPVTSEFVYSVLRQAPIFDSVADATLRGLLSGASVYRFQKGRLIYGEG